MYKIFFIILLTSSTFALSNDCPRVLNQIFTDSDIENLGNIDCSRVTRGNQRDNACNCIDSYLTTYNLDRPQTLSPRSLESLKESILEAAKKNLLSLSLDIVSASNNPQVGSINLNESCNIQEKFTNKTCEGPSLFNQSERVNITNQITGEIKNGYKSSPIFNSFPENSLINRDEIGGCELSDSVVASINNRAQKFALVSFMEIASQYSQNSNVNNITELIQGISNELSSQEKDKIETFLESQRTNPQMNTFLNNNEFFDQLKASNFDPNRALALYSGAQNSNLLRESIISKCEEVFDNLDSVLCLSSQDQLLSSEFREFKNRILSNDRNPSESIDDLSDINNDLSIFCSHESESTYDNLLTEINNTSYPHIQNARSVEQAAVQDFEFRIQSKKENSSSLNTSADGLALCDYVPTPNFSGERKSIVEAFENNCGLNLAQDGSTSPISGQDDKMLTYQCHMTMALWETHGDQIMQIEALEASIKLSESSSLPESEQVITYNGAQIPINEARVLNTQLISQLFSEEQRIPTIVASYIGEETTESPTALAVSNPTPGQPTTTATGAVAPQVQSQTAATQGSQSNRARSFASGFPQANLDSDTESSARVAGNFQQSNPNQVEENMNDFYTEFASRLRANNDQDIASMQNEVQELSSQVAGNNPGRTDRPRSRLTPTLEAAIDNPGARELFASSAPSDVNQNGFAPRISQSSVSANDAPADIIESERADENSALNSRNRALSRAAAAGSNATSRGPASVGAASNGGGSLSITPASSNTTPLDAGNAIAQINIENDTNLDTALVNIAEQNPAVARQLLDLLQNDQVRSFYITNNDYRVLINKRNGEFVVRSEGNEADPGYINFLTSVRQSVQIQSNFENLISQLTAIN